jgi:ADP-dependent NAD(P)H-hydrate dehydratase / NAD(P)H-hydrate epimerase
MPLPAPLLRANPRSSKKSFGHLLIIAGSPSMLGAAALSSLAAMHSGAGLVTAAVPKGLNLTLQKKISNVVMTKPLAQSRTGLFSFKAYDQVKKIWDQFDAIAIGPGLGRERSAQQLAREVIIHCPKPLVIDADALFALAGHAQILLKAKGARVLTPHSGEMSRLTGQSVRAIEASRLKTARDFARQYHCVLLLKGHRSVAASPQGKTYINHTGNVGMATAGSGDVLTGMITALLGQKLSPFDAAKFGAYYHGRAGDLAARTKGKLGMTALDIIDHLKESYA